MVRAKLEISNRLIDGGARDVGDDEAEKDVRGCSFNEDHDDFFGEFEVWLMERRGNK